MVWDIFATVLSGFFYDISTSFSTIQKILEKYVEKWFCFPHGIYVPEISLDSSVISIKKAASLIVLSSTFL